VSTFFANGTSQLLKKQESYHYNPSQFHFSFAPSSSSLGGKFALFCSYLVFFFVLRKNGNMFHGTYIKW